MNKPSLKYILVAAVVAAVVAVLGSPSAFAQTWTDNDLTQDWNDANNWSPTTIPNVAGATATINLAQGGFSQNVDLGATSDTVGILNIGTSDSTAGGTYLLEGSSGGTLTLNNNGAVGGAQINELSTAVGDTISAPIIMADTNGLNITTSMTSATNTFQINGGITGTGNLTFTNNSAATGNAILTNGGNSLINNVGTLTIAGTGTGTVRFQGGVGSNVTQIIQDSNTSLLYFAGTGITVNSGGTTIIANGTGGMGADGGLGTTCTGNVTLENNTSDNDVASISGANNVGEIISAGTGAGIDQVGGNIGSNVTKIVVVAGSTSGIEVRGGSLTINTGGTTILEDDSNVSTNGLQVKQNVTGTGNLVLDNDSSVGQGILLAEQTIDNTGEVINSGTGTGSSRFNSNSSLGTNVTNVVEDSSSSELVFRDSNYANYTNLLTVQEGTLQLAGGVVMTGAHIVVGDTAADGAGAFLSLSQLNGGGILTLGAAQTVSGFGSISDGSITSVSGSTIAPGSLGNIGKLTFASGSNLTLANGTNLTFRLGTAGLTPAAGISSMLADGGTLSLTAGLNLNLSDNANANSQGSLGVGDYELMSYNSLTGAPLNDITSMFNITGPGGYTYDLTDTSITGPGDIDLTVTSAVPEPGTWAMLLGGLGLLLGLQRFRSRRA